MATDVGLGYTEGSGRQVAALRDAGGVDHQKALAEFVGADTEPVKVSRETPMPMEPVGELIEAIEALRMAMGALVRTVGQTLPDTQARMRVNLETVAAGLTLGNISTLTTLTTLTNQTQIGGQPAAEQIPALMRLGADSLRRNIQVT